MFGNRVAFAKKETFLAKLQKAKAKGPSKLSIVTDFDFTLTKLYINGVRGASCHKVIEDCGLLSQDYHTHAQALQLKYYPIEIDPDMDTETKTKYMIEWVTNAHKLLCGSGLTNKVISQAVVNAIRNSKIELRKGVPSFFNILSEHKVPTLIFSAGIADVLEKVLKVECDLDWSLLHVISNRCIFSSIETTTMFHCEEADFQNSEQVVVSSSVVDIMTHSLTTTLHGVENAVENIDSPCNNINRSYLTPIIANSDDNRRNTDKSHDLHLHSSNNNTDDGKLIGFHEPVLHVFNKQSSAYLHTPFFQRSDTSERSTVILIGDSLGDISMCEGMPYEEDTLIKIGLLNDRVEERLAQYLAVFDIVILGDAGFEVPIHIIETICGTSNTTFDF